MVQIIRHFAIASLIHWGRVTHICVSKLTIIGSDNGLSPGRRQAVIWTSAGLIGTLGTNYSEILIEIHTFSFKNMLLKMLSGKWRPFCLASMCVHAGGCHWGSIRVSSIVQVVSWMAQLTFYSEKLLYDQRYSGYHTGCTCIYTDRCYL